jgi:hypothetical protein
MTISLLTTKLYIPPVRPELISRPRLIERLNAGLHRRLTLISAPAGFGKTTLLSEWVHDLEARFFPKNLASGPPLPVAWFSLDEGDNDPGWTPLFLNASGIILEVGDMLQHGALVAREYGKPCVSGLEHATEILKDEQMVEMDGANGIVRLI